MGCLKLKYFLILFQTSSLALLLLLSLPLGWTLWGFCQKVQFHKFHFWSNKVLPVLFRFMCFCILHILHFMVAYRVKVQSVRRAYILPIWYRDIFTFPQTRWRYKTRNVVLLCTISSSIWIFQYFPNRFFSLWKTLLVHLDRILNLLHKGKWKQYLRIRIYAFIQWAKQNCIIFSYSFSSQLKGNIRQTE